MAMVAAGLRRRRPGNPADRAERSTGVVGDPSHLIRLVPAKGARDGSSPTVHLDPAAPRVGIERVPPDLRRLGFLDEAVLWGNPRRPPARAGRQALLVPALGLVPALAATVVGAVVGNALNRFTGGPQERQPLPGGRASEGMLNNPGSRVLRCGSVGPTRAPLGANFPLHGHLPNRLGSSGRLHGRFASPSHSGRRTAPAWRGCGRRSDHDQPPARRPRR